MIKNILLIIVAVAVIILVFRSVDFSKDTITDITGPSNVEDDTFRPGADDVLSLRFDNTSSVVEWTGRNTLQNKSHTGTLSLKDDVSYITLVPSNEAGDMRVLGGGIVIDMTSLKGANEPEQLITHLKSEDFFFVEQYPTATFVVSDSSENTIDGTLSIRDIGKNISVPYEIQKDGERYIIQGSFTIDRTEWDITTMSSNFFENLGNSIVDDTIELRFVFVTQ